MIALAYAVLSGPAVSPKDDLDHDDGHLHESAQRRLTFDESIGASASSPIVTGFEDAAQDKRARDRDIPRLSRNPQLTVMPGARVNAGDDNGFEFQGTLSQSWNLEGYGRARRSSARAETEVLESEARAKALEQQFGAAKAWVRLHAAEQSLALARADLELAEQLVATLETAREAGVATRVEVAEARTIAAETAAVVVELAGEVHDLGLALARETNKLMTTPLGTQGDYPNPALPDEAELRRRFAEVDKLPAVQLRRVRARAALAVANETERSRGALLTTGVSIQRESMGDVVAFGLIGASIPIVDRNQREQASARAAARQSEAQAEQLAIELSAVLGIALHELRHTRERVELLRDRTLPALDELITARTAALELGEGTRVLLLEAQHERTAVARKLAAAEADWVWARVEVWLYLEALDTEDR